MIEPREMHLQQEAIISLGHILGIMTDQMSMSEKSIWNVEHLYDLDARIAEHIDGESITLGIDDVALLLEGMAFTEVMSADFPWIEMVRWTSDFVTSELRQYWSEDQWRNYLR